MLHLLLAATIAVAQPTTSPANSNPCAHRTTAFCGPVRLLPKDPTERRAFVTRIMLQVADGVVTSAGLRGNRARYPDLASVAASKWSCPECSTVGPAVLLPALGYARPKAAIEIDPFVAPASHGGLPTMIIGGIAWDITTARLQRAWSPLQRASFDRLEAGSHALGIATWIPILNWERTLGARYRSCAARVGQFSLGTGPDGTNPTVLLNGQMPAAGMVAPHPDAECQFFSRVPVSRVGS